MSKKLTVSRPLISKILDEYFEDVPFPEFAELYDKSYPVIEPERMIPSDENVHEARLIAEEFRIRRPICDYNLLCVEVAFPLFYSKAMAYFIPKFLSEFVANNIQGKIADIADITLEFLSDDRNNKQERIYNEMLPMYSESQRNALGLAILFLCYKLDDISEKYETLWFYKNTLRSLNSSQ